MRPDPVRCADTRAWLVKARGDLRRAEALLGIDPPDTEGAVFHCQQAAEKALKGFLVWHDVPFRRVHDIDVVGGQCVELDATLRDLVGRADVLSKYSWQYRYPGEPFEPAYSEASDAIKLATEVFVAVTNRLPSEAQP